MNGEIKGLDMPRMTIVFRVTDASMLDKVHVGDKVKFKAALSEGSYVVIETQPAR